MVETDHNIQRIFEYSEQIVDFTLKLILKLMVCLPYLSVHV